MTFFHNKIVVWLLVFLVFGIRAKAASPARFVFAHYMVCFATYGPTVEGYQRDIREAQEAGIDGFALNVGAWSGPDTYYKARVKMLFDAAEKLGTGFKLFFSVEITNTADIVEMVSSYANRPNAFHYLGKLVVSSYGQNDIPSKGQAGVDWAGGVFPLLAKQGISVCFVPHFWPDPVQELPSYQDAEQLLKKYNGLIDGLFLFGAAGLPEQLSQCNSNYTKAAHEAGKISMSSFTPSYWGAAQYGIGRRYFESRGGEGICLQWNSIIQSQPDWVEIVTWNDWNESSYMSPIDDPAKYFGELAKLRRYSHSGFERLSKRYITWFKTGQEPPIKRDALFYSYRTHPKDATASDSTDVPVKWFIGDVQDLIYTTVALTAPANLEIASGGTLTTNSLPSGIQHLRIPFHPGAQQFVLRRGINEVLSLEGPKILSQIEVYNFFPATGYAFSPAALIPPSGVRLVPRN